MDRTTHAPFNASTDASTKDETLVRDATDDEIAAYVYVVPERRPP